MHTSTHRANFMVSYFMPSHVRTLIGRLEVEVTVEDGRKKGEPIESGHVAISFGSSWRRSKPKRRPGPGPVAIEQVRAAPKCQCLQSTLDCRLSGCLAH